MRILMVHRPGGAFGYITDSWLNALCDKGHIAQRWDGQESSWRAFAPDFYIGCSGHRQTIPTNRGSCKIAIHVNPYGPTSIDGINESTNTIQWVLAQRPDAVFGYGHEEDRHFWSHWTTRHGIQWVPMPTAGDKVLFKQAPVDRVYDVVYLGGRWDYKGLTIDAYLMPVLRDQTIRSKLYGWGKWPDGISAGILPDGDVCGFLNSGLVGPCIAERHTHQYGIDIPERAFKVALCGALVVHDNVPQIKRMIPSAVVASNPSEFKMYCRHYSLPENDDERRALAQRQQHEVLMSQTYHHRMATLFAALGFDEDAKRMCDA